MELDGHYSLQVDRYTWATSPICRYMDVVLQRQILLALGQVGSPYVPGDIDELCQDFSCQYRCAQSFQRWACGLNLAAWLKTQPQSKLGFVVAAEDTCFKLFFPASHKTLLDLDPVHCSSLQPPKHPCGRPGGCGCSSYGGAALTPRSLCLEHVEQPGDGFSPCVPLVGRDWHQDVEDEAHVWEPFCCLESATRAAAENDPVTLQDVAIPCGVERTPQGQLQGTFCLEPAFLQERGIDISFGHCYPYRKVLGQAWKFELDRHRTVLFTCWHAGSSSLEDLDIRQILADEAGVASEPETLIPLVNFSQAEKVVLLGDHKQLRPVVRSELLQKLGLDRSLWQRYFRGACLWDVQYHMLSAQSSWAQGEFYERELKIWQGLGRPPSVLGHADEKGCSVIFGHLQSKEKSRLLSTDEEGEDSKAKDEEMAVGSLGEEAEELREPRVGQTSGLASPAPLVPQVCIARELPLRGTVGPKDIAILTPYNAQVAEISKRLEHQEDVPRVTVCSITKIQGGAGTGWEACARGVRRPPPSALLPGLVLTPGPL
ncbi:Helicase with zinc finger domain 2 [Camelus dromedarius]|uniref:Helicase with zinc finger domain 2 n=1 Tax=Camelus dromedarius TaxID=9838 RepID=A0A5N4CUA7_CAMDR|nr:Helicase with zinc finger domain 2 [Camelus dromedarius]